MDSKDKLLEEKFNEFMSDIASIHLKNRWGKLNANERKVAEFAFKMGYMEGYNIAATEENTSKD